MKIATANTRKSVKWKTVDMSWDDLLDKLRNCQRTGETVAEYKRMTKDEKAQVKDRGGFVGGALSGARRISGACTERWVITLDADENASQLDGEDFYSLYGPAMAVYSTHSHTTESPRLRWIIPLSRGVSRDEYQALARKVAQLINIESMDTSTYEPERLMYWPSAPCDAPVVYREYEGKPLNPDDILAEYGAGDEWKDCWRWPTSSREDAVVKRDAKKAGNPLEKPGIIGKFCRAYNVEEAIAAFIPGVYEPADSGMGKPRYTYAGGSSSGGAIVEDDGLFLYSHHATDPCGGQLVNAFDLVRIHLFGAQDDGQETQEIKRRPSYKAMCELAAKDERVIELDVQERMAQTEAVFGDLGDPDPNIEWAKQLKYTKNGEVDNCMENAALILKHDERIAGSFALDEMSGRVVIRKALPWRRPKNADKTLWSDFDDAHLRLWFEKSWGLRGRQDIMDAFQVTADRNSFHPVREYLNGLPAWDGVPRVETLLHDWMAADDNEYVRTVTRKWMVAAVKRIYEPGCKFDTMLVLEGQQGIGKSRLPRILSKGWFTDSAIDLDKPKDAYDLIRGVWIAEWAELAAAKKAEVEHIKSFISNPTDTFRPAYGRNTVVAPRQCVFYGSTNESEFLRDRTGARRFWVVHVKGVNRGLLNGLEEQVDQIWAEAKGYYELGEELYIEDDAILDAAREIQSAYTVQDELTGMVEEYLDTPILPAEEWDAMSLYDRRSYYAQDSIAPKLGTVRRTSVCISELRCELCGEEPSRGGGNDMLSRKLSNIMNNLPGWTRSGKRIRVTGYGLQRVYTREEV